MYIVSFVSAVVFALVNGWTLAGYFPGLVQKGGRISYAECITACVLSAAALNMAADRSQLYIFELMFLAAVTDLSEHRISNEIIIVGAVICLCRTVCALQAGAPLTDELARIMIGMAAGGGVFAAAHILTGRGIGAGDVKFFSMLGLLSGWNHALYLTGMSLLLMTIYAAVGLVRGTLDRKTGIAMAPFAFAAELILTVFSI